VTRKSAIFGALAVAAVTLLVLPLLYRSPTPTGTTLGTVTAFSEAVAQSTCDAAFCSTLAAECGSFCQEQFDSDAEQSLCETGCNAKATHCESCCADGGTAGECWP